MRILFVLKLREDYNLCECYSCKTASTGMYNSVRFVLDMLEGEGVEAKMVVVVDNNSIDREVAAYRPTHVIIEGFWVVPEKFDVLKRLHKTVKWLVRCHSDVPFLAGEGSAFGWFFGYIRRGVAVACNSPRMTKEFRMLAREKGYGAYGDDVSLVPYLPNYYPVTGFKRFVPAPRDGFLDVGLFGAVRPLKNHMTQAVAMVSLARDWSLRLRLHINSGVTAMGGQGVVKNLRSMFSEMSHFHKLVEHPWMEHDKFLALVATMDLCTQVSFSETFNIVSADAVSNGVPIVVSPEVNWAAGFCKANCTDTDVIKETAKRALLFPERNVRNNQWGLIHFSEESANVWREFVGKQR
jgi:hypothetical protein